MHGEWLGIAGIAGIVRRCGSGISARFLHHRGPWPVARGEGKGKRKKKKVGGRGKRGKGGQGVEEVLMRRPMINFHSGVSSWQIQGYFPILTSSSSDWIPSSNFNS